MVDLIQCFFELQDLLDDEQRVLASQPYQLLNDQVQYLRSEVERYEGLVDQLQVCRFLTQFDSILCKVICRYFCWVCILVALFFPQMNMSLVICPVYLLFLPSFPGCSLYNLIINSSCDSVQYDSNCKYEVNILVVLYWIVAFYCRPHQDTDCEKCDFAVPIGIRGEK